MPKYVLNRDHLHRSTMGVISFEEGVAAFVPAYMEKEVIAIGAERESGDTPSPLEDVAKLAQIPQGIEREGEIKAAFALLIERNETSDFTGAGVPTVKAVEKIVGYDVDRKEITDLWAALKAGE